MSKSKYQTPNSHVFIMLVGMVVMLFGAVHLGVKIDHPNLSVLSSALDATIVLIGMMFSMFVCSYFAAVDTIKRWLINECSEDDSKPVQPNTSAGPKDYAED